MCESRLIDRVPLTDEEIRAATVGELSGPKRELAARDWKFVQNYANAKTDVIEQIIGRALAP